jgi:hypothetical protein
MTPQVTEPFTPIFIVAVAPVKMAPSPVSLGKLLPPHLVVSSQLSPLLPAQV